MTAPIVFIDTETTSLRPDRRVWEIGLISRKRVGDVTDALRYDEEHHFFVATEDLDLGNADPFALKVGRFYERHPDVLFADNPNHCIPNVAKVRPELHVLHEVERLTRGAHLIGAIPSFDAEVLATRMREHGICPSWHYHLIDVEALSIGYLNGRNVQGTADVVKLPWKSDELTEVLGLEPTSDADRHTALGDARWARAIYDVVTG